MNRVLITSGQDRGPFAGGEKITETITELLYGNIDRKATIFDSSCVACNSRSTELPRNLPRSLQFAWAHIHPQHEPDALRGDWADVRPASADNTLVEFHNCLHILGGDTLAGQHMPLDTGVDLPLFFLVVLCNLALFPLLLADA